MKSIVRVELKRVLKSRTTIILAGIAVVLSFALAIMLVMFLEYTEIDDSGEVATYTGFEAAQKIREGDNGFEGYLEPSVIRDIYERYLALYKQYDGNIPDKVYVKEIQPVFKILYLVSGVYHDSSKSYWAAPENLTPEQAEDFYEQRIIHQEREYFVSIQDDPMALAQARALESHVEKPFYYVTYNGWLNVGEYLTFAIFLVAFVCVFITAPTFSSEYQSGSDDILRCTKNGRAKLAFAKSIVSLGLSLMLYLICIFLYCGFMHIILGDAGMKAPLQIFRVDTPIPINFGETLMLVLICGVISLMAIVCFSLFASARSKSPLTSIIVCVIMMLAPMFASLGSEFTVVNWVKYLLPSCGVGENSIFYELLSNIHFLSAGPISIWAPYVMTAAALIEIVLFFSLAIRAYSKHETK